jgi:hypothetical protein
MLIVQPKMTRQVVIITLKGWALSSEVAKLDIGTVTHWVPV